MCDIIKRPSECSEKEKDNFFALVKKGGEVNISTLKDLIERAKLLAFHYENNNLVGVAGLKCPYGSHKNRVFQQAEVTEQSDKYNLEFGWAYTEKIYQRKGIGSSLIQEILNSEGSQGIYATTRENNNTMQRILENKGFEKIGKHFLNEKGYYLLLFTRPIIS